MGLTQRKSRDNGKDMGTMKNWADDLQAVLAFQGSWNGGAITTGDKIIEARNFVDVEEMAVFVRMWGVAIDEAVRVFTDHRPTTTTVTTSILVCYMLWDDEPKQGNVKEGGFVALRMGSSSSEAIEFRIIERQNGNQEVSTYLDAPNQKILVQSPWCNFLHDAK